MIYMMHVVFNKITFKKYIYMYIFLRLKFLQKGVLIIFEATFVYDLVGILNNVDGRMKEHRPCKMTFKE